MPSSSGRRIRQRHEEPRYASVDWSASPSYRRLLTPDEEEEPQLPRFGGEYTSFGYFGPFRGAFPCSRESRPGHISFPAFLRWRVPSTGQERHQSRRFQDSSEYPRILRWLQSFLLLRCLSLRMKPPGGEGAAPGTYGCVHVCFGFTASVHQHFCFHRAGLELSDYVSDIRFRPTPHADPRRASLHGTNLGFLRQLIAELDPDIPETLDRFTADANMLLDYLAHFGLEE